jgi:hydroxymethylpyrimidine/phosphomethylpyrimidine kinase
LSIAGFDPSAGAGVLADVKTFEQHQVMGFGVNTCITYQTENQFLGLDWLENKQIENQLVPLLKQYKIEFVKIGMIHKSQLDFVLDILPESIKIIWDPILKTSTGFDLENNFDKNYIESIAKRIHLITPNLLEFKSLNLDNLEKSPNILLKAGHRTDTQNDLLLEPNNQETEIKGKIFDKKFEKHGSGCVLSAAITANLTLGFSLFEACEKAKSYTENFLASNDGLLGWHKM